MSSTDAIEHQVGLAYADHHAWLRAWLRRKLGCAADAEDIAHDSFLRLLRQLRHPTTSSHQSSEVREPRAWLVTVAGRLVKDHWRHQAVEQAWLDAIALQPEPLDISPEQRLMVLQALEQLLKILDGMPARDKSVFLYAQLEGMSYAHIAQEMGISINMVQKAMGRALMRCYQATYCLP